MAPERPAPAPLDLSRVERITTGDGASGAFGTSVAIDGDTLVVGAPGQVLSHAPGAAYVFQRDAAGWHQTAKLVHLGKKGQCERLGLAVGIAGNTIVAGGRKCGEIFERTASGWKPHTFLTTEHPEYFGEKVAIAGDTIVVSDSWEDFSADANQAGAVHVYRHVNDSWARETTLTAAPPRWGETFGSDAAIGGGVIAVGARQAMRGGVEAVGALHLFERGSGAGAEWKETLTFQPDDGRSFLTVGHSVAVDGDVALAGSPSGRKAYAFERRAGHWHPIGTLDGPAPERGNENFCATLALRGDDAAIASIPTSGTSIPLIPGTNTLDAEALAKRRASEGATVHIYQRGPQGWRHTAALTHPEHQAGDELGRGLAFGRGVLAAGAPGIDEVLVFSGASH